MIVDVSPALGIDYYAIEELLTDEEREIRDRVRAFCEKEVIPVIGGYWDRAEFPFALLPKLAELNIMGGTIEGYGCPGMSEVASGLVAAEMACGDGSLNTFYGGHSALTMSAIAMLGNEDQKEKWLPPMARLEKVGAFGLTEARHGSDVVALETTARREGDEYVIEGEKRWIGNANFADLTVIWARDEEGNVGGFLVEKETLGFSTEVITGKTAKRAVWQAEINLRDPDARRTPRGCSGILGQSGPLPLPPGTPRGVCRAGQTHHREPDAQRGGDKARRGDTHDAAVVAPLRSWESGVGKLREWVEDDGLIRSYRDLRVWKEGMDPAQMCYEATKAFPREEVYGMIAQVRRAATAIRANMAEGRGRENPEEFVQFLRIAQGSLKELARLTCYWRPG